MEPQDQIKQMQIRQMQIKQMQIRQMQIKQLQIKQMQSKQSKLSKLSKAEIYIYIYIYIYIKQNAYSVDRGMFVWIDRGQVRDTAVCLDLIQRSSSGGIVL